MTETLFIRLGSQPTDTIYWLIVDESSDDDQAIIASGDLSGAEQLSELTSKAEHRKVKIIVPGCDVLLKSLKIPAKSNRAVRLAAPYVLEDSVAEDVDKLFFAYADLPHDIQDNNCFVAIVSHSQMARWISWLAEAEIETTFMLPDVLTIPYTEKGWSAITLGNAQQEQVIVRQHLWQGFTLDASTWQLQCEAFSNQAAEIYENDENAEPPVSVHIEAYSPLAYSDKFDIAEMPEELPLALMAKNYSSKLNRFNLLQGKYKVKEVRSHARQQWLWVAGVAMFALLLNLSHKGAQLWHLNAEQDRVQQSIIDQYKVAFPKTKRVRVSTIKSQLNRELALLGGVSDKEGFLAMLAKIQPAFAKVPTLKPESLKFDGKRQELRLQATAKDYQTFEKFSIALAETGLEVKKGSQSNQGELVSGSFSITNKTKGKKTAAIYQQSNKRNKETS
ncbi:type II secretion system protein GspL [Colwellia echini]|uniref:Type II secretion system protein L n=1 Tax=Colwellia echini TaxID=1982103 RepID=A0ABY3N1M7_9GAMM|nr:type II secretion system protein GspL [Colwellia echini]TYK67132.1 type II secretion system protein GspL [Colwellia echini]